MDRQMTLEEVVSRWLVSGLKVHAKECRREAARARKAFRKEGPYKRASERLAEAWEQSANAFECRISGAQACEDCGAIGVYGGPVRQDHSEWCKHFVPESLVKEGRKHG